jgi:hypothetical protein
MATRSDDFYDNANGHLKDDTEMAISLLQNKGIQGVLDFPPTTPRFAW